MGKWELLADKLAALIARRVCGCPKACRTGGAAWKVVQGLTRFAMRRYYRGW